MTFQRNSSCTHSRLHGGWSIWQVIRRLEKKENGHWITRWYTFFRHDELLVHYLTGFSSLPSFLFLGFIILSTVTVLRGFCGVSGMSCFFRFHSLPLFPSFSGGRGKFCPIPGQKEVLELERLQWHFPCNILATSSLVEDGDRGGALGLVPTTADYFSSGAEPGQAVGLWQALLAHR